MNKDFDFYLGRWKVENQRLSAVAGMSGMGKLHSGSA
jgi:hypothetical protein